MIRYVCADKTGKVIWQRVFMGLGAKEQRLKSIDGHVVPAVNANADAIARRGFRIFQGGRILKLGFRGFETKKSEGQILSPRFL